MITEWFLQLMAGFVGMIADALGPWTPPSELVQASTGVSDVLSNFNGMGAWVSWTVLSACVVTQIATWAVVVGAKVVRAIAAHIPEFGGAGD